MEIFERENSNIQVAPSFFLGGKEGQLNYSLLSIVHACCHFENVRGTVQLFVRKGQFPASQGRIKKEAKGQSADFQLNRLPLSPIQAAPFLKKKRALNIDSLVQRQIALLFPSWNFSYNPLYQVFCSDFQSKLLISVYLSKSWINANILFDFD